MGHELFSYRSHKDGVIRIFWGDRCVMTLGGSRGLRLSSELAAAEFDEEVQALLQRATGNFKRGNERSSKRR